jgi:hypothetical protein
MKNVAKTAHQIAGVALIAMPVVVLIAAVQVHFFGQDLIEQILLHGKIFLVALAFAHIANGVAGSNLNSTFIQDGIVPLLKFPIEMVWVFFTHSNQLKQIDANLAPLDKAKIFPRLKNIDFLDSVAALLKTLGKLADGQMPVTKSFCGDILISYGADTGASYSSISQADLASLDISAHQLHELALENLRREVSGKITFGRLRTFSIWKCGIENLTAASLLLPEACQAAEKFAGASGLRFMIPSPDRVAFISPNQSGTVDGQDYSARQCFEVMVLGLREAANQAKNMAISCNPIEYSDGEWRNIELPNP